RGTAGARRGPRAPRPGDPPPAPTPFRAPRRGRPGGGARAGRVAPDLRVGVVLGRNPGTLAVPGGVDHEVRHGGRVRAHVRRAVLAAAGEPDGDAGRHLLAVGDRLVGALEAGRVDEEAVRPADVRADQAVGHDLGARPRVLAAVEVDGGVRIRLEALDGPAQVVVTLFGGALRVAVRLAWQPGQGAGLQDDDGRRAADLGGDAVDPLVVLVELL